MADPNTNTLPAVPTSTEPIPDNQTGGGFAQAQRAGGSMGVIPAVTYGMEYKDVGVPGLRAFSGWVREEFLPQLLGRQAAQKYREMMDNSPVIGAIMFAVISTMRKVEWRVIPADDSGAAQAEAEFVESCMHDMSSTWEDVVVENLSMLGYGFATHEIVYKRRLGREPGPDPARPGHMLPKSDYDDGLVGWRRLPIRGQDTILKWFFDENGQVKGVTQQPWTGQIIDIPIEKLLLFRPSQHKGNPEGRSILRTAYVPYYFVKRLQEQEAIMGERMGGLPMVKVPSTLIEAANSGEAGAVAALNAYKRMAINVRIDEQMGIMLPSDMWEGPNGVSTAPKFSFELVTPQGGRGQAMNFSETITRYNTLIMTSVLADFLMLGHTAHGTQNLAVEKVDLFFQAVEGFLNSNAAVYNRHALPRLWALNGKDPDLMPTIEPDMAVQLDLDMLSQFVLRLSQAGMPLFPDDELQSYIRDAAGLPDVTDDAALQAAGLTPEQLAMQDEQAAAMLEQAKNPPEGPPGNLEKMLLASIARRMVRHAGPKFGVTTATKRGFAKRR